MRRLALLVSLLIAMGAHAIDSPRLRALESDLKNVPDALQKFWKEVESHGTPLIEPIPDRPGWSHVTFVIRGSATTRNAVIITMGNPQIASDRYLALAVASRLADTNVWYRTYRIRNDARFAYRIGLDDPLTLLSDVPPADRGRRLEHLVPDPFNPKRLGGTASVVEMPNAPPEAWTREVADLDSHIHSHTIKSAILQSDRTIRVYAPSQCEAPSASCSVLVALDGESPGTPTAVMVANLIAAKQIPPTIVVLVHNSPGARGRDLGFSDDFARFIGDEVMPFVARTYAIMDDPRRSVIGGQSLGASAAAFVALRLPKRFGNVIALSGGFAYSRVLRPPDTILGGGLAEDDFPEGEYLAREFATRPRLPIRFFVSVGTLEDITWESALPPYATASVLLASRHFRDVLEARGYDLTYEENAGGHDWLHWRVAYPRALVKLLNPP